MGTDAGPGVLDIINIIIGGLWGLGASPTLGVRARRVLRGPDGASIPPPLHQLYAWHDQRRRRAATALRGRPGPDLGRDTAPV